MFVLMPKHLLVLFFTLTFFTAPTFAAPGESKRFKESMRLYEKGKFTQSSEILVQLLKTHPNSALYWFNLGNCAFMAKNFSKAVQYYQKVISLGGNLTPAAKLYQAKTYQALGKTEKASEILENLSKERLPAALAKQVDDDRSTLQVQSDAEEKALTAYQQNRHSEAERMLASQSEEKLSASGRLLLGLTYIRLNKTNEADRTLNRLLALPSLSPEDRLTAQDLLKRVRRKELENTPYWAYADISHGFSNNIYLDPKSGSPAKSSVSKAALGAGYHFHQGEKWSEKLSYSLFYEFPHQAPELKTLTHTVQAPVILKTPDVDASLVPYIQQQSWDEVTVSRKLGLTSRNTYTNDQYEVGLDLDYASQSAVDSSYSYLNGSGQSVKPYVGWWSPDVYTQLYFLKGSDGTQDLAYTDGSLLPMRHSYQGFGGRLLWRASLPLTLAFDLSQMKRTYGTPSLPTNTARVDTETALGFKVAYTLSPGLLTYLLAESSSNSSTLTAADVRDKNYEALFWSLGLSWEVF
jgi:tetratricopeptide (TPR) repeat protein